MTGARKSRAKPKDVGGDAPKHQRAPDIQWAKNPDWTYSLIAYLSDHLDFRLQLFSDSTAKDSRPKLTAKGGKIQQYGVLAKHIFASEPGQSALYFQNPGRYGISVETRLRRLKLEYIAYLKVLGSTGAGLDPSAVTEGSPIADIIADIRSKWPWWDELHGYWRQLPHYNPQSSEPGTLRASDAVALCQVAPADEDASDHGNGDAEGDRDEASGLNSQDDDAITWDATPSLTQQRYASSPAPPSTQPPPSRADSSPSKTASGKLPVSRRGKTVTVKKTAIDRFLDSLENETRRLTQKRKMDHDEKMARIRLKMHKYTLRYGPVSRTPDIPNTTESAEDKQIQILRLQIRIAELTQRNNAGASSSKMVHSPLYNEGTPSGSGRPVPHLSGYVEQWLRHHCREQ